MKFDDNQIEHYQWHGGKIMLSSRFVLPALFLFFLACTTQIHMKSIIMHTINLLGIHLYALSHIARCAIYAKNIEAATNFGKKNIFDSRKIGTAADATAKKKCWVEKKSVHSTHVKCEKEPPCQRGKKAWNILEFCVAKDSFDLSVFNMHIINPYDTTTQAHGEHHTQRMEFEQCFVACLFLAGAFIFICYQRLPVGTKYFLSTSLCCRACVSC